MELITLNTEEELNYYKSLEPKSKYRDIKFRFICHKCNKLCEKGLRKLKYPFYCKYCTRKNTNFERFGNENPCSNTDIKNKKDKTMIEKYGYVCPLKNEQRKIQILEKAKNTKKEKYGNEYYTNIEQTKKTKQEKYKNQFWNNPNKIKQTCKELYNVDNIFQNENIKNKIIEQNLNKYGVKFYSQTEDWSIKCKKTCNERYGTDYTFQVEDFKEKARQTNIKKYGVEYPAQNHEIYSKQRKKYKYNNINFDSLAEIDLYKYCIENNIDFEYHPNVTFEYEYKGKIHYYEPDFLIEDNYIELKGLHFFENKNPNGKMINPFGRKEASLDEIEYNDGLAEAKHQCMIKNDIIIIIV